MPKQSFANHVRYYPPHHFVFYPLLLAAIGCSVYAFNHFPDEKYFWLAIIVLFLFIGWIAFMLRQHYALGNQNRLVRMEMRFRYYVVTGSRLEPLESKLSFAQIAALRFASDEELEALTKKAVDEKLSATEIKKEIIHWQPDLMRV